MKASTRTTLIVTIFVLLLLDFYGVGLLSVLIGKGNLIHGGWQESFKNEYAQDPLHTIKTVFSGGPVPAEQRAHDWWVKLQIPFLLFSGITVYKMMRLGKKAAKDASDYGAHGTSRWAKPREIREWWLQPSGTKGLFLGQFEGKYTIHPLVSKLNQNMIVFGGAGSQKSRAVVIPNIFKAADDGFSMMLTDTKGDVYNKTSKYLIEKGYKIYVLNYLRPKQSNCWNILDFAHDTSDVMKLAKTIIDNTTNKHSASDEMWKNAEMAYLAACILYIKRERPPEEHHMPSVLAFGTWGANNQEVLDQVFDSLPPHHEAAQMYNIFRIAEYRVRAGILIGFATRLQIFIDPGIAHMWSKSDFSMMDLGQEKVALFMLISDRDTTYEMPIALTWAQLFQDLYDEADNNGGTLKVPVRCPMDEFANIGTIDNFEKITSTCRSRGIFLMPILQSLPQLKNRYDKDRWAEIIGNMDTIQFLATNDKDTAEYFSFRIGKTTLMVQSYSQRESGIGAMNESYMGRSLLNPDELLKWDRTKTIIMQNGRDPAVLDKVDFTELDFEIGEADWTKLPEHQNLRVQITEGSTDLINFVL